MEHGIPGGAAALVISLALVVGVVGQALARHLRVPGIVLLLAAGVLLGPDVAGIIDPGALPPGLLFGLVGFAVAIILFEGGLNLKLARLRRQNRPVRRLITLGAAVTLVGGAAAAHLFLGWDWKMSLLFGSLVIVTGPTVITPLLRRIKVKTALATILEAEGVLIDGIGALAAIVALEIALRPQALESWTAGAGDFAARLSVGVILGVVAGGVVAAVLRRHGMIPAGLENVFVLAVVLALYEVSNTLSPESGIGAVIVAGFVVGNVRTRALRDLTEFKEQLTVMFIGLLFVLLAADIRIAEVVGLGIPGLLTVLVLMLVVRPVGVALSTAGSGLSVRERAFLAWLGPRGIVAAAVASLFAETMEVAGIEGGRELRALVFLVIAATVTIQGLSGGALARWLGVRRPSDDGYVILGAGGLGLALGRVLRAAGEKVVFLDADDRNTRRAADDDFRVVYGNALEERTLLRAQIATRSGVIAATRNEEANLLFARSALGEHGCPRAWVALQSGNQGVTPDMIRQLGGGVLFGRPRDVDYWHLWLDRGRAGLELWRHEGIEAVGEDSGLDPILPLVRIRGETVTPVEDVDAFDAGDEAWFAIRTQREEEARDLLTQRGWSRVEALVPALPVAASGSNAP